MTSSELIASVFADYIPFGKNRQHSVIGISAPFESDKCFGCCVCLPDQSIPYKIYGEDSLQSIGLAFAFLRTRIKDMQNKGDSFYYPGTEDQIPFDSYFPTT